MKKKETPQERELRHKKRKFDFKQTYKSGIFGDPQQVRKILEGEDVTVRMIDSGTLNDDSEFMTIRIEGIR